MRTLFYQTSIVILFVFASCTGSKKTTTSSTTQSDGSAKSSDYEMLNSQTFALKEVTTDETYGYTAKNPIKVGGAKQSSGPLNERRFLNALLGSAGQEVTYERKGSCCAFKTPNGLFENTGLLDIYEVTYEGLAQPAKLYINMYDDGILKAPKGFTFKQ
jgi:hypothetical protein